jgi:hypothetical protein
MEMRSASPQAQIQAARHAVLEDETEITFQPGGGYVASTRVERGDGVLELIVECFDRNGRSGGRQTATICGSRLAAQL